MRRVLLIAFVLVAAASMAFAAGGRIGVFGDTGGLNCVVTQPAQNNLFQIYLVHIDPVPGVSGSQFYAPKPACLNALWLADQNVFPVVVGSTQTGYSAGYGSCKTTNTHVVTMSFLSQGTSATCCVYYVLPDPALPSGEYEFADCDFNVIYGEGKAGLINDNPPTCTCETVPAEETSWGKIKSLWSE